MQKIREAERDKQYDVYKDRIGEIINGQVKRVEYGNVVVDLGGAGAGEAVCVATNSCREKCSGPATVSAPMCMTSGAKRGVRRFSSFVPIFIFFFFFLKKKKKKKKKKFVLTDDLIRATLRREKAALKEAKRAAKPPRAASRPSVKKPKT